MYINIINFFSSLFFLQIYAFINLHVDRTTDYNELEFSWYDMIDMKCTAHIFCTISFIEMYTFGTARCCNRSPCSVELSALDSDYSWRLLLPSLQSSPPCPEDSCKSPLPWCLLSSRYFAFCLQKFWLKEINIILKNMNLHE